MERLLKISVLVGALLGASCDAYRWPPFKNESAQMFHDNVETMLAIEQGMIADGRTSAGSGLAQGHQRLRHGEPELTPKQLDKYALLFQDLGFYGTFFRVDDTTQVRLIKQVVRSRDFYITYIHSSRPVESIPCATADRSSSCGECYQPLQADWIVYYRWYPERDLDNPGECTNDCC